MGEAIEPRKVRSPRRALQHATFGERLHQRETTAEREYSRERLLAAEHGWHPSPFLIGNHQQSGAGAAA